MSIDYASRPAWRNYWFPVSVGLLSIPIFGAGLLILLWVVVQRYGNRYTIERNKIESQAGIVSRELRSIRLENLRDVYLKQTIMQRLFSVGDLAFSSSGQSAQEVMFLGVSKPLDLKTEIEDYLYLRAQAS